MPVEIGREGRDRARGRYGAPVAHQVSVRGLALACHPGPTAVVTSLALALAVGVGAPVGVAATVTAAVFAGQLSIGWSNDWIDAQRDVAAGRTDKPIVGGSVGAGHLRVAALTAAGACVPLSFAVGWDAGLVHVAAVACGWAYNDGLKSGVWSWLPYAVAFGLLPVFIVLALPAGSTTAGWAIAAGALLGVGAHLANVLPDLEDDRAHGIHGLPHRLGRTPTSVLAPAVLGVAVAVVVLAPAGGPGPVAWAGGLLAVLLAVAAGVVALTRPRSRVPFTLTMAVAAACVTLLVLAGPQVALGV